MPKIKPVSELRNYTSVLEEVHENEPVYLTKNGHGAYVISTAKDYEEYERLKAAFWMRGELEKTVAYDKEHGYVSEEEMKRRYGR